MSLPFTQSPAEPQLKDVLDQLRKDVFLNLNCHHIGTLQSFDLDDQTASVTINYKKTFYELNAATGLYSPILIDYPISIDCPVIFLGGGPTALTMPVKTGDECLVLFNDRDLDNWFQGGSGTSPATPRLHSFADAIILVGVRSLANSLDNFDATRAVLRGGDAVMGVNPSLNKVLIANVAPSGSGGSLTYATTLNTLVQQLITAVNSLVSATAAITVTCAAPGSPSSPPINASTINAVATTLSSVATQIAGLLE